MLAQLEATEAEPEGDDQDLITQLHLMAEHGTHVGSAPVEPVAEGSASISRRTGRGRRAHRTGPWSANCVPVKYRWTSLNVLSARPRSKSRHRWRPAAPEPKDAPSAASPKKEPKKEPKPAAKKASGDSEVHEADKVANQSIRVNVDTLEHLMTMVSELVLTRNQLLEISRRNEDTEFKVPLQRLSNVTAELQEGVMKTRMQPIGNAWQKLPRIVRYLSGELGKHIELEMHGADTELDRQVLDLIKDPLTHMVRNSADHGLETPAERLASGKPEQGTIRLSAYHEGGHIIICIADNGRGLNTERIKAKAVSNGLVTEADLEKMSEAQIHKFIFAPGFSTAAAVTSVFRPRRRHGRGAHQYRPDRRHHRHQVGGRRGLFRHHQDSADACHRLGADRRSCRRPLCDPAIVVWSNWYGARANSEHRIERIKDTAVLRLRNKLLPLVHLKKLLKIRRRLLDRSGERFHRRHPGRQPDFRHRRRRRGVPHRGNRGQADVDQAAPHRHVLRQYHSGRRCGDHDY